MEQKRLNHLKKRTEKKLVQLLVDFIFREYTQYPRENEVILVCKAALQLFDGLKGGIVSAHFCFF